MHEKVFIGDEFRSKIEVLITILVDTDACQSHTNHHYTPTRTGGNQ